MDDKYAFKNIDYIPVHNFKSLNTAVFKVLIFLVYLDLCHIIIKYILHFLRTKPCGIVENFNN